MAHPSDGYNVRKTARRDLPAMTNNESAFQDQRDRANAWPATAPRQDATLSSDPQVKADIDRALGVCGDGVSTLTGLAGELDSEDLHRVEHLIGKLHGIALARRQHPAMSGDRPPWKPFNELTRSQFTTIQVDRYRGIDGLALEDLQRVNLIAGVNDAGKTSLLEAIYLLARQNDESALLDVHRWRGRINGELDPAWLMEQLQPEIRISGRFDAVTDNAARLEVRRLDELDDEIKDQRHFLTKLAFTSHYGDRAQHTDVTLSSDLPPQANYRGGRWLCRSAFTSSFRANRPGLLLEASAEAPTTAGKAKMVEFVKARVDARLTNIELADERHRLLVRHRDFDRSLDLSSFGDGMQRIFEIGLLFAGVRGGVLLIDGFESAIHPQLLVAFARVVQELAVEYNVQVFLTTHSKEALDAFILNDYATDDIAGYAVCRGESGVAVRRFDGEKLARLHKALDFDLRGMGAEAAW